MRAVRYGLRAAIRRRRQIVLPALTTATGTALLTIVLSSFPTIRRQAAQFGDPGALAHTTVAVSVLISLVGALEVAICAMRSVNQRRAEIGVLSATGASPRSVLVSLTVEPFSSAVAGGLLGALVGVLGVVILRASGSLSSPVAAWVVARSGVIAVFFAVLASLVASLFPISRAVRQPPLASLSQTD